MPDLLLAIDVGTQSLRAIVFDVQGRVLARVQRSLLPYKEPQPGWVEQSPDYFWQLLCEATCALWEQGVAPERIAALAVTTQRGTVVNLDQHGRPLREAMIWMDQRRCETLPPLPWYWRLAFFLSGRASTIRALRARCQANWIAVHQPEVWDKTAHFLALSGYLNYRLCAEVVDSSANQVGYLPFDHRRRRWAGRFNWMWAAVALRPGTLPALVEPGQVLGRVSTEAAQASTLLPGTPVVAAAGDKASELLGAGCLDAEVANISLGTQASISVLSRRYRQPLPPLPAFVAAVSARWCAEVSIGRGFWLVTWFAQQFGEQERRLAEAQGCAVETVLDEMAATVAAGCDGLVIQPYWDNGVVFPGPEARGSMIGFRHNHSRAHVYRALLEGLAYALREGRERIEQTGGISVRLIRLSGGGSRSDLVAQMMADVMDVPVERTEHADAAALGAAINAAVAMDLHADYQAAVAEMCRSKDRWLPNEAQRATYDRLYRQVYRHIYPRLRNLLRRL